MAADSVSLFALTQTPAENMLSRARSRVFGSVASNANSLAAGTMEIRSLVRAASGSSIATPDLMVKSETNERLDRTPISDADTLASHFVEQTREVTRQITQ